MLAAILRIRAPARLTNLRRRLTGFTSVTCRACSASSMLRKSGYMSNDNVDLSERRFHCNEELHNDGGVVDDFELHVEGRFEDIPSSSIFLSYSSLIIIGYPSLPHTMSHFSTYVILLECRWAERATKNSSQDRKRNASGCSVVHESIRKSF